MVRLIGASILGALVCVSAGAAQDTAPATGNVNVEIKDKKELEAAKAVEKAATSKSATADQTITAAQAFLEKYPQSVALGAIQAHVYNKIIESPVDAKRMEYIQAFKAMFPTSDHNLDLARSSVGYQISQHEFAVAAKICEEWLTKHPDDVTTHVMILDLSVDAMKPPSLSGALLPSGKTHGLHAAEMIETDRRDEELADPAKWKSYKDRTLPHVYQQLGLIGLASSDDKSAAEYLQKSLQLAPNDPLSLLFLAKVKESDYNALAEKYNNAIDKESAKAKQALADAQAKKDEIIAMLIKAVVAAEALPELANVGKAARLELERNYQERHDGKLEGLEDAIKAAKVAK